MTSTHRWPLVVRDRLGDEGVAAFLDAERQWKEDVLVTATERFESRLVAETASLRLEMSGIEGRISLKLKDCEVKLHDEIASVKTDLIRWSFAFWVGQLVSVGGLLALVG